MQIISKIRQTTSSGAEKFKKLSHRQLISLGLVVGALIGGGFVLLNYGTTETAKTIGAIAREVSVASVLELSNSRSALPLIGTVTSISEATIRAEGSGQIVGVYRKLGDFAGAGTIIAELENSRERAAVQAAEAGVKSAEAAAGISAISGEREKDLLTEAKVSAINSIRSAYDVIDDTIRSKIDPMFVDPNLVNPKFLVTLPDSQLAIHINFERLQATEILKQQENRKASLSTQDDVKAELDRAEKDLRFIKDFLDDVISGLNQGIPTPAASQQTIDGWKLTGSIARTTLNANLSGISLAKDNLTGKEAALAISGKQTGSGVTTSDAALRQAEAGLRLARINLEKTFLRSPISGTLNSFSLERGDFVTAFQEIAVVSNNNALEIRAYITEEDAREIRVGAKAVIEGSVNGVVTKVAPALDPRTKKIEVRIGITQNGAALVNGESVRIDLSRTTQELDTKAKISIPIAAIKITADGPVVFTVEDDGTLKSHVVTEGALLGDTIIIENGVTPEMKIVLDARGLKEGATVTIKK